MSIPSKNDDPNWFGNLFNSSPDPTWIIQDHKFIECNDAAVKHLGYSSREELLNLHPSELSPHKQPDGEESFIKAERMFSITKKIGQNRFEWVHTKANGENFIAEVTLLKIDFDGKDTFYCVWRDITERLQSEEVWKFALEGSGDGVWNFDFRTGNNIVSKRMLDILGIEPPVSESEYSINDWIDRLHPDCVAVTMMAFDEVVSNKSDSYVVEQRARGDDGAFRWLLTRGKVTFRDDEGRPLRMIGTASDITESKFAADELRNSYAKLEMKEKEKSRFLAAAGHDLRQPLAAANLFIDALKFTALRPEQNQIIQRLDQAMSNFNELLDALLDVSKLEAGILKPENISIQAADIFRWLDESFSPMANEKHIRLKLYYPMSKEVVVHADIGLLKSVFINLVSNAIKYTLSGSILISARPRGEKVLFQIWDTGIGIDDVNIENIFEEFYQVGNQQRDRAKGIGLGLSIVKRTLDILGTEIHCRSQLGKGSIFSFYLPMEKRVSNGALHESFSLEFPEQEASLVFVKGKRFIVVEDDEMVSEALSSALEVMGGVVERFHSAKTALQHADLGNADCFIVDYMLPDSIDGINFLLEVRRKLQKPICAVMMSGNTSSNFISKAELFDWPVLHKPVNLESLIDLLSKQY